MSNRYQDMLARDCSETSICLFFDYIDESVPASSIFNLCEELVRIFKIKASIAEFSRGSSSSIKKIKLSTLVKNFSDASFPDDIDFLSIKGGGVDGSDVSFVWEPKWIISLEKRGGINSAFVSVPHGDGKNFLDVAIIVSKYIKSRLISGFYYPTFLSPQSYFYGITYNNAQRKMRLSEVEAERNYMWRSYSKNRKKGGYILREVYPFYVFDINTDNSLLYLFEKISALGVYRNEEMFGRNVKVVELNQDFILKIRDLSSYKDMFVCDANFKSRFFWQKNLRCISGC